MLSRAHWCLSASKTMAMSHPHAASGSARAVATAIAVTTQRWAIAATPLSAPRELQRHFTTARRTQPHQKLHDDVMGASAVLSPLPLAASDDSALLASAGLSPAEKVRALSRMTGVELFATPSHQELMHALVEQCDRLARGQFEWNNGAHARLLQGPKGIGKTTMLRAFTMACEAAFPDVIPIYLTFNEVMTMDCPLHGEDIMHVVARQLQERGVQIATTTTTTCSDAVVRGLRASGKRVLLLVDEIDQLYRVGDADQSLFKVAGSSLGNLAFLGDRSLGLFSVLLCGSSATCPLFVTCNGTASLMVEFPRLRGAPNLNGQKYRVWRIPSPLPNDLAVVRNIMEVRNRGNAVDDRAVRLVGFVAGGCARNVCTAADMNVSARALEARLPDWQESALRTLSEPAGKLYKALMGRIRDVNAEMMAALLTDGLLDPAKVATVPWEAALQPVSWEDIQHCWSVVHAGSVDKSHDLAELQRALFGMSDRGYVVYGDLVNGVPHAIYPTSAAALFVLSGASDQRALDQRTLATWNARLKAFVSEVGKDVLVGLSVDLILKNCGV
jgi:hypothetical protein